MELLFIFSVVAMLAWSGSDFFSKQGTQIKDKNSHWKVVFAVGLIMGIHFVITLIGGAIIEDPESVPAFVASLFYTDFVPMDFVRYLPVAALYILAMVFGYIGLRYIELSISSPICNCSGALAFLLCILFGLDDVESLTAPVIVGVVLVTLGIVGLGVVERYESDEVKIARQSDSDRKYTKSLLAFLLPIAHHRLRRQLVV